MTKYCSEFTPSKREFKLPGGKRFRGFLAGLLIVLLCGTIAGYLYEVNRITAKGFESRDLENQISALADENEKLQLTIIELQTMPTLMAKIEKLKMVPADDVAFYTGGNQVFARK